MLVLSRKTLQSIKIGDHITVMILGVRGNVVRIGIDVPKEIVVDRKEVSDRKKRDAA